MQQPFSELKTDRLLLRQLTLHDTGSIYRLRSDLENNKYLNRPAAKNPADAEQFIKNINEGISKNDVLYWGICLKENSIKVIGTICLWNISADGLKAETGYEILPEFQGKGYISEALKAILNYGFEIMKLNCIDAFVDKNNIKSIKIIERFGFIKMHEGDELLYSLQKK